jgi:hypothetical protein
MDSDRTRKVTAMTRTQYLAQKTLEYENEYQPERSTTPTRLRRRRWTKASRDSSKRKSVKVTGKAGIHRRRNKRVNW